MNPLQPVVAVDIGNTSLRAACFQAAVGERPRPLDWPEGFPPPPRNREALAAWAPSAEGPPLSWWIASVHQPTCDAVLWTLAARRPRDTVRVLQPRDFGLTLAVLHPERVGPDRVAAAAAANARRRPDRGALVVDSGTAITVDVLSRQGVFLGGAILPGVAMSAKALNAFTDRLPLVSPPVSPPPPVGKSTEEAIASGLYWGGLGAVSRLLRAMSHEAGEQPEIFVTASAAAWVEDLGEPAHVVDDLVLEGVAIAAAGGRCG